VELTESDRRSNRLPLISFRIAHLGHDFDGKRTDVARRFGAGALNFRAVTECGAQKTFAEVTGQELPVLFKSQKTSPSPKANRLAGFGNQSV